VIWSIFAVQGQQPFLFFLHQTTASTVPTGSSLMTRKTLATIVITVLLLFLMIWSFGSSAATSKPGSTGQNPQTQEQSSLGVAAEDENEPDADLGKFGSQINREQYLRERDEYIARKRGIEPGRPFDPTLRGRAIEQMERQEKNSRIESIVNGDLTPASGGAWTPIGPLTLPNGVGSNSGPTSGRVTAIAVDPTNSQKVYLGTAQGGVWRSLDGGTTWISIFDNAQTMAIGALSVAPSNPTILYVGTGEFNGCGDCFFGVGLYRIDNADTSASLVGPINPQQTIGNQTYNVFNGRSITKILVHPNDPATIWVSTGRGIGGIGASGLGSLPAIAPRGVFRSNNATASALPPTSGGVAFQKLLVNTDSSFDSPGTGDADISDMVMQPGTPDNILVGAIGRQTGFGGIYRTTNGTAATPAFTQVYPAASTGIRISLAINKVGSVVTAYAATSETPSSGSCTTAANSGLIRKQVDPFNDSSTWATQLAGGAGFCASQCFYDMPIAVDPNDANHVYIGGQASSTCGRLVGKSIDGGTQFVSDGSGLHVDEHALVFDSSGNIFTGNDGGVWKGVPNGSSATTWTNLNTSPLNTLQFQSVAVHPSDQFLMLGGTQDNGTEFQQTSSGNWRRTESGDGGYALIDQSATDATNVTMYHTFFNDNTQVGFDRNNKVACLPCFDSWEGRGAGPFASGAVPLCDGTSSTTACDGSPSSLSNGLVLTSTVLFYAPMALGPGSPNTLYFGADRLYRSNDRGDTMPAVSQVPLTSPASPISTIAIWNGGDNIRMVGTQNGQVWATSTGSSTLVNITPPIPANPTGSTTNKFIGRAMIDPNNKNVAYVTLSYYAPAGQGVWKITNLNAAAGSSPGAAVWAAAGNGIPSVPINAFAIDPLNSNNLYAGTDIGVYFSNDAGASWTPFGTGLPRVAVFDLAIQPTSRLLRAATHGRGIWETSLVNPAASTMQFNVSSMSVAEGSASSPTDATVTVTRSGDTSFPASVNYATSDTSGANPCGAITGIASSRCDYIATSGTLNFAANETSKQISIPIWSDSYTEGSEVFTMNLTNASGLNASVGGPATITITITDSGFTGANQIDSSNFFVRQHYVDFLNREPDASGLAFWSNQMTNCGATDLTVCKINVSGAFFLSIEFQQTGYLVERIYKAAFGDASGTSTAGGTHTLKVPVIRLNQFLPDTQRIGQGVVVNVGNWQQQLDDNKNAFTEEFVQRPAFLAALPPSMTPLQFVDALNGNAKDNNNVLPLSQADHDNLVTALTNGTMTRAQVLRFVAEYPVLANSEKNRAFVLMQYFGYLRRNPNDPQDTDYTGYEFWLSKLNQFNGDYIGAEMVKAFINASEYRQRFGAN
jgi:Calx-beta domain-containing protein